MSKLLNPGREFNANKDVAMLERRTIYKVSLVCAILLLLVSSAYAGEWCPRGPCLNRSLSYPAFGSFTLRLPGGFISLGVGGANYFYGDGIYYRRHKNGFVVVEPPIGAFVRRLPNHYQLVVIGKERYYTYGGVYYRYARNGYELVRPPHVRVIEQPRHDKRIVVVDRHRPLRRDTKVIYIKR